MTSLNSASVSQNEATTGIEPVDHSDRHAGTNGAYPMIAKGALYAAGHDDSGDRFDMWRAACEVEQAWLRKLRQEHDRRDDTPRFIVDGIETRSDGR